MTEGGSTKLGLGVTYDPATLGKLYVNVQDTI